MKKKNIFIFSLIFVLIISLIIINSKNNKLYDVNKNQIKKDNNRLSMMLETGIETGEYEISTSDKLPSSGYTFNSELSKCENGGELSWDSVNKAVVMSGNKSDKCYIYFDKDFVRLSLDNYTFKWDAVEGASTYQIYSDGELLTTTSDTSAEIYDLYNDAGNYDISVKALDNSGDLIMDSNVYNYELEKISNPIGVYLHKLSFYKVTDGSFSSSCSTLSPCYTWFTINGVSYGSTIFLSDYYQNEDFTIFSFDLYDYLKKQNINFKHNSVGVFATNSEFAIPIYYCKENDCTSNLLSSFSLLIDSKVTLSYDLDNDKFKVTSTGVGKYVYGIQIAKAGFIPSDWIFVEMTILCLSSNTEVYVYDKKKKRFKKKKISEVDYDDELLCWDFDNGCFAVAKPIWIMKEKQTFKYNKLTFSDGNILETINQHRIFNVEKGMFTYPMTDDTPIGTTTLNANGEYVKLVSKEEVEEPIMYYNVMTNYHINLFANNILTSSRLSNIYPIKDLKYICKKKRNNEYDFSSYNEYLVKGLRLNEQNIEEKSLKKYVDNMLRIKK